MKLGIIGLGFMGSTHLKAALTLPGIEVAAVSSRDEKKLAGDFSEIRGNNSDPGGQVDMSGIAKYREMSALLADRSLDAVDICLPSGMHEAATLAALAAGKHVLVEKPMALDGDGADRMTAAAERSGRVLMAGQVIRFWPEYAALREKVRDGSLGAFRGATFRRRCAAPSWGTWEGGGAFDLLIHDFDFVLHLLGRPEALSAAGYCHDGNGIDLLHALLFYANGAEVLVTGGWMNRGSYPFSMEFTATFDRDTVEFSTATGIGVQEHPPGHAFAAELAYFARCCAGQPNDLCPPRQSADAIKLLRAALEARHRKGEKIECTF